MYNKKADLEQFEAYSERLGADAPFDFDAFQALKYSQPDVWTELKGLYSYKGRVPEATKADFGLYRKVRDTGVKGTVRVPPAAIDLSSVTFVDEHATHHGVTLDQAKEFILTAKFSLKRRRWDGVKVNYYSKTGAAYTNESGQINTAFSSADFDPTIKKAMEVFEE